jgi:hypothetical protein
MSAPQFPHTSSSSSVSFTPGSKASEQPFVTQPSPSKIESMSESNRCCETLSQILMIPRQVCEFFLRVYQGCKSWMLRWSRAIFPKFLQPKGWNTTQQPTTTQNTGESSFVASKEDHMPAKDKLSSTEVTKPRPIEQRPVKDPEDREVTKPRPIEQRPVKDPKNIAFIDFYMGRTRNEPNGPTMKEILEEWSDGRLEDEHQYIQWLFPLRTFSHYNPSAPLLNDELVGALNTLDLHCRMGRSFNRMMRFYGLTYNLKSQKRDPGKGSSLPELMRAPNYAERRKIWLTPGNHNFLRITRMLKCLTEVGLKKLNADPFLEILTDIYKKEGKGIISEKTFKFWQNAVRDGEKTNQVNLRSLVLGPE